jgi:FkbM family methyltransferase
MIYKLKLIFLVFCKVYFKYYNQRYRFKNYDFVLFCLELLYKKEKCEIVNRGKTHNIIKVAETKIAWPIDAKYTDLSWLHGEVFAPFRFNPSSYAHPRINIKSKNWIIDAGASEGYFTLQSIKHISSDAKIVSIEPSSILAKALTKTVNMNKKQASQVEILQCGIADSNRKARLVVDINNLSDNFIKDASSGEVIDLKTIDNICMERNFKCFGHIKMDVEGFEMLALKGAVETMKKYKPSFAIAVYHELNNASECAEIIKRANPSYQIIFRGCYGYFDPPRPYMLYAF